MKRRLSMTGCKHSELAGQRSIPATGGLLQDASGLLSRRPFAAMVRSPDSLRSQGPLNEFHTVYGSWNSQHFWR